MVTWLIKFRGSLGTTTCHGRSLSSSECVSVVGSAVVTEPVSSKTRVVASVPLLWARHPTSRRGSRLMEETLTYDAVSSNKLSAMADIGVRVFGVHSAGITDPRIQGWRLNSATTVAQNLFLYLVHFPCPGSRLIIEAMQM